MASVFAVVSKKVFESDARVAGKVLGLGGLWPTDKYKSTHAALKPLAGGGHLFLVTVRPPDEALWLIAVLRDVKGVPDGWKSVANTTPITDITSLKGKIMFATGTGITAAKGKLGMSLQTPRALTNADVTLLLGAPSAGSPGGGAGAGGGGGAAPAGASSAAAKVYHLNRHETGPLPCLCAKCLPKSTDRVVVDGETFLRREATAKGRVLYYWLPESTESAAKAVRYTIERRMETHLPAVVDHFAAAGSKKGKAKRRPKDDDEDDEDDDE